MVDNSYWPPGSCVISDKTFHSINPVDDSGDYGVQRWPDHDHATAKLKEKEFVKIAIQYNTKQKLFAA